MRVVTTIEDRHPLGVEYGLRRIAEERAAHKDEEVRQIERELLGRLVSRQTNGA